MLKKIKGKKIEYAIYAVFGIFFCICIWVLIKAPCWSQKLLALPVMASILGVVASMWKFFRLEATNKLSLLHELEINKICAEKEKRGGYQFSTYEEAKKSTYFLSDIPNDLRIKIGKAYSKILDFHYNKKNVNIPKDIPELKELLEDILPEFEDYLKSCGVKK